MFRLPENLRFYIYTGKVNLHRGCLSLCELVRIAMGCDPLDARNVYIFLNSSRTIVRLIHYERGFYVMHEKHPGSGRIRKSLYDSKSWKYQIPYIPYTANVYLT